MLWSRGRKIFCWLLAIAFITWAQVDHRLRDAEGFLRGGYCLPIAAGIVLFNLGFATSRAWNRFAAWLSLALAGQAVALQMIDAGNTIHYQHYHTFSRLLDFSTSGPWLLAFLLAQTA